MPITHLKQQLWEENRVAVKPTQGHIREMLYDHGGGVTVKGWGEFLLLFKGHSFNQQGLSTVLEAMRRSGAVRVETRRNGCVRVWLRRQECNKQPNLSRAA
jgi:hypothetical protein